MRGKTIGFWLVTVVIMLVVLVPIFWIFMTAFKPPLDIFSTDVTKLFGFTPTVENFTRLIKDFQYWPNLRNTGIIAVASTALVMLVSVPAAYSFARWNTGSGHLLFITISTRMFPGVVAALPFFFLFKNLGLLDTHLGLTLLYLYFNMSFATFLLFGFFREIPVELEQSAMVDGYTRLDIFRKVVFPLVKPGIAITAVFCLIWSFNEFFYAFLFTRIAARTVPVLLSTFWGCNEIEYGPMAAGAALTILPTLVVAWFMQRYIIRGLTFGAVKG